MKILFNDIIQYSDAPKELKSPALSDFYKVNNAFFRITFDKRYNYNCIGIGNIDGTFLTINDEHNINFKGNGLYEIPYHANMDNITIDTDATYIGRFAVGIACNIPTSITKEPSIMSTSEPRVTLSGQIIAGAGGYNYRALSLDSRYKITKEIMQEIEAGYKFIGMGYPFFIDLSDESYKLTFDKLYANERSQRSMTFQSGVNRFLYSRRFEFEERF